VFETGRLTWTGLALADHRDSDGVVLRGQGDLVGPVDADAVADGDEAGVVDVQVSDAVDEGPSVRGGCLSRHRCR
jgi:hypothetical protein